jgi:hypothetical protein
VTIASAPLVPAWRAALAETKWPGAVLAVHCAQTLQRLGKKVHDPTAFLATHLKTRVRASMTFTPRMEYAGLLAWLEDQVDDGRTVAEVEEGMQAVGITVTDEVRQRLGWGSYPDALQVPDAWLDRMVTVVTRVKEGCREP